MIDRIIRRSYNEYVIIFTNRSPIVVHSSGNALELLKYFLGWGDYAQKQAG